MEMKALEENGSTYRLLSLESSQSTYDDRVEFGFKDNKIYASVAENGNPKINANIIIDDPLSFNKVALKYSNQSGCSLYINGV